MGRLLPHPGHATFKPGEVVYEPGGRQSYICSPTTAIISLLYLLETRREGVTAAAGRLQEQGLVSYVRGRITVIDRRGLEASVCECYKVVGGGYDRLLGRAPSPHPCLNCRIRVLSHVQLLTHRV